MGMQGYFRDPWFALNLLREMWLLFNPREMWFVYYRDPWFHKYFPRCKPHFHRKNNEKFRFRYHSTENRKWRNSYAAMEYYRYKCRCTFHAEETLLVGWGTRNIYWWCVPWHICAGTFQKGVLLLGAGTSQKGGGGIRNLHSPKKWVLMNLTCTKRGC